MFKTTFGKRKLMRFASPEEYYETLGFIAKSDGSSEIYREENQNQGAWSYEVRMNCYNNLQKFPSSLKNKFTKGRGKKVKHRINCNEFFEDLVNTHGFSLSKTQNLVQIRLTIPQQYQINFDRGNNL